MKFNLFKNDKSTVLDEVILFAFILICFGIGGVLCVKAPAFWIIDSATTKVFGVMWILVAVMFIPGLIYRLMTNDKK